MPTISRSGGSAHSALHSSFAVSPCSPFNIGYHYSTSVCLRHSLPPLHLPLLRTTQSSHARTPAQSDKPRGINESARLFQTGRLSLMSFAGLAEGFLNHACISAF